MQPDHRARYTFGFALLAALLAALILWNLNTGSLHPPSYGKCVCRG